MSKSSRRKQSYRDNASKLHMTVGDMLRSSPLFSNYRIYQEYPVNMICSFDSGREKFDWVIMDLKVVIEVHGQQHYKPVRFGGMTQEEAENKYRRQIASDNLKMEAVKQAGWAYIVFAYDEDITLESLISKISTASANKDITPCKNNTKDEPDATRKQSPNKQKHAEQLQRAKEYRKQQYNRYKEWRKANGDRGRS